ncbi:MAG: hypothetical protein GEU77_12700 [Deltaproteobacteria bacterium]|nr:hypothetical protein [Deltaproteobacteria bacterium]
MKTHFFSIAISLLIVAAAPAPNFAQTTSASSTPATNISNDFSYFLQKVDSKQVVNDLRNGQWTNTATDPTTNTSTTTTEALPTGKMGYGNVKISLALAQESLRQQGIMQPTSEQLHTALVGDSTTQTNGILQMRADGMGWGQIAQKYDVKLGQLMSGKQPVATTTTSTTTTSTTGKGITTAAGKSSADVSVTATGKGHGKAFSGTKSQGTGIVSASGRTAGTSSSSISHAGRGIVSGSGRSMGHTSGIVTGAGNGHQYGASGSGHGNAGGHGKGHSK